MPVLAALSLRALREELCLSQTEAAKRLGITCQAYQRFENPCSANPTLRTLEKVARAFGKRFVLTLEDGDQNGRKLAAACNWNPDVYNSVPSASE